jgi:hypothetical protein
MLFLFVWGCTTATQITFEVCDLTLQPDPARGLPGDLVVIRGGPMSIGPDTTALVDGTVAEVVSVDREGCDFCDACQAEAECLACEPCIVCETLCEACVQSTTVRLPDVGPGLTSLALVNAFGSGSVPFRMLGGDTGDTGAPLGSTADTGAAAGSTADTGAAAGSTADTGAAAGSTADTGAAAGSTADTGPNATADTAVPTPIATGDTGAAPDTSAPAGQTADTAAPGVGSTTADTSTPVTVSDTAADTAHTGSAPAGSTGDTTDTANTP